MNKSATYTFCFVLTLLACRVSAQTSFMPMGDIEGFKNKLVTMSESTQTIVSDFIQEKNLSVLSEKIISKGQFFFKKENNIRWEYTEPTQYLIIISNNQLFTRDEKNQKLYDIQSNKMFQEMNRFISGCIQGELLKNDEDYAIAYFENNRQYFVKLVPRAEKMKEMLNEVQIFFDKNDLTVSGLKMVESGDDYTKIDFINKQLNVEVPLEKFSFK
ncbi:MAG: outer membrane lipoprotein carrier protein LolA [Bacteroidales bacterium]|nr:outer membrane lipoprotein carrier protein LolA [Bacteroidales bacterium]MBN2763863.1 outer membrane lipoprotein carrier protein LolA [Bacteroidales bacterium]